MNKSLNLIFIIIFGFSINLQAYANLNSNAFNIISNLKTGENSNNLELNYDNSNLINLKILNENNKEFSNLDKTKGSDLAPLAIPASLLIGITVKFTTEVVKKGLIKYGGKYFTNRLLNENEEVYILQRDEAEDLIDELGSSSKIDIDDLDKYELQESDGDLSDTQINNNSNSAITTSPNPKKDDDKDKNDKKNDTTKYKDHMVGQNGTSTKGGSQTIAKLKNGSRIDVENPNPGKRAGQIHYQNGNEKYLYDLTNKKFVNFNNTGIDAPKSIQNLLKNKDMKNAINKAMKFLGEN